MADLVVVVPTRGRPANAAELVQAFNDTCTAETAVVFAIDENDPELASYQSVLAGLTLRIPVNVGVIANPSNMVYALNQAAVAIAKTQKPYAIGFMGDDHRPITPGWDSAYLAALGDLSTGIVYGDDLVQHEGLPTQCAMTSDIVTALGYMAPPNLKHMYVDNFWRDLGNKADCLRYLPKVVVQHQHPIAKTAEWDEGYKRVNSPETYQVDEQAYAAYRIHQFASDVETVKALRPNQIHEWRLFDEGTVPEYTEPAWYDGREHAPHLEQREHRDRLMATATLVAQAAFQYGLSKVVDLGSGDGGLLSLLGPAFDAWGYDLMPANLDVAKARGVDVRYGNVLSDDIDWADIAVCTEMLEHLVDPHGFVATIAKHCKVLVCSSPRLETGSDHYEFHTWAWDLEGYRNLLQANGFEVKRQQQVGMFQVLLAVRP